ncbi:hypothetical protein ABTD85_20970, partial [Acinetobacter baumannii]
MLADSADHTMEPMSQADQDTELGHRSFGRHTGEAPPAPRAVETAVVDEIADPVASQRASLQISAQRAASRSARNRL